jgi:type IV pilus assembly protein PilX
MVMTIKKLSQHNFKRRLMHTAAKTQKGLVLFFALIALVAMSLAAAALIRSVDTSVLVAGNLAFKQSATTTGDTGMISAMDWINAAGAINASVPANGYYARTRITTITSDVGDTWPDGAAWTPGVTSRLATGSGFPSGSPGYDPLTGNTVQYVIERMCRNEGVASVSTCLMGSSSTGGNSLSDKSDPQLGGLANYALSPMYRVTARVAGPKNTISYIQAYVY